MSDIEIMAELRDNALTRTKLLDEDLYDTGLDRYGPEGLHHLTAAIANSLEVYETADRIIEHAEHKAEYEQREANRAAHGTKRVPNPGKGGAI